MVKLQKLLPSPMIFHCKNQKLFPGLGLHFCIASYSQLIQVSLLKYKVPSVVLPLEGKTGESISNSIIHGLLGTEIMTSVVVVTLAVARLWRDAVCACAKFPMWVGLTHNRVNYIKVSFAVHHLLVDSQTEISLMSNFIVTSVPLNKVFYVRELATELNFIVGTSIPLTSLGSC